MRSPAESRPAGGGGPFGLQPLAAIVVCFGAVFVLSQFFRAANAVIAKTLSAEFGLSPESLGLLTGMFFLAFGMGSFAATLAGFTADRWGVDAVFLVLAAVSGGGAVISAALFYLARGARRRAAGAAS